MAARASGGRGLDSVVATLDRWLQSYDGERLLFVTYHQTATVVAKSFAYARSFPGQRRPGRSSVNA